MIIAYVYTRRITIFSKKTSSRSTVLERKGDLPAMSLPEEYKYLPWLAAVMLAELTMIVCFVRYYHRKAVLASRVPDEAGLLVNSAMYSNVHASAHSDGDGLLIPTSQVLAARQEALAHELNFLRPINFKDTYSSYGPLTQKLLLLTRLCSFLYFSCASLLINDLVHHEWDYHYFTTWNLYLLSTFYLIAFTASLVGMCYQDTRGWERSKLGMAVHMLYELSGSSAFLVTVVAYTFLDHSFSFWNMSIHLVTSGCTVLELLLNHMTVLPIHCLLILMWASAYLVFIWIAVTTGVVSAWPYPFLETDAPSSFLWYSGLLFSCMGFYFGFERLSRIKLHFHNAYLRRNALQLEVEHEKNMFADPIGTLDSRQNYSYLGVA